jgi:DNA-binding response OmpR family regulator
MEPRKTYAYREETVYEMPDDLLPTEVRRVLLLEDDRELAQLLKELLEGGPFQVETVANGSEGLKSILARDYDVIVCDMVMPGFPGEMFYLAVERTKPHLCRRFVFTTGHRADPGIDAFIRRIKGLMLWKPFQPHELFDAIKVVLRRTATDFAGPR